MMNREDFLKSAALMLAAIQFPIAVQAKAETSLQDYEVINGIEFHTLQLHSYQWAYGEKPGTFHVYKNRDGLNFPNVTEGEFLKQFLRPGTKKIYAYYRGNRAGTFSLYPGGKHIFIVPRNFELTNDGIHYYYRKNY